MPISENISILIKLQKETKLNEPLFKFLSVSLFPFETVVIEVQNLIQDWKYTRIYLLDCFETSSETLYFGDFFSLTYSEMAFCGCWRCFWLRLLEFKPAGEQRRGSYSGRSIETLTRCCNFYSYYQAGDSHGGACLFEHFTAQWLLYVTWGLPFDNCTLCVRIAFMSYVFIS